MSKELRANGYVVSGFDGTLGGLIGISLLQLLISVVTLGLGIPFAVCIGIRWQMRHTVVEGKRLYFKGNGFQLWGNVLKWLFCTVFTLGIYGFWLPIKYNEWVAKHLVLYRHWKDNNYRRYHTKTHSAFDGKLKGLIGITVLQLLVIILTLGLGIPFAFCMGKKWAMGHTIVEGRRLGFDGNGFQYWGNIFKWLFFTLITLGVYAFWIPVMEMRWVAKHFYFQTPEGLVDDYILMEKGGRSQKIPETYDRYDNLVRYDKYSQRYVRYDDDNDEYDIFARYY